MFLESSCYALSDTKTLRPNITAPTYTETNTGKYNFLFLHFGSGSVSATPKSDYPVLVADALMSGVSATPKSDYPVLVADALMSGVSATHNSDYGVEVLDTDLPSVASSATSVYGI